MKKFMKGKEAYAAEFLGTFYLVLCIAGAAAAGSRFPGSGNAVGGALGAGLALMTLVYSFGPVSGAHFNPAVTLAFFSIGRFKKEDLLPYLGCQFAGAIFASFLLKALLQSPSLGVTSSPLPLMEAWCIELLLTYMLVGVIMGITDEKDSLGKAAVGLAIGGALAADAIWGGPLTGASMNPARSFGPALASGEFGQLWIYLTAPLAGGWLAAQSYMLLHPHPNPKAK
jgi:MIP family channel proteins